MDTEGLLRKGVVHPADLSDRTAVHLPLVGLADVCPRLCHIWVDAGYTGTGVEWIEATLSWSVEVVKRPPRRSWWPVDSDPPALPSGFQVLPRRWVVERTFAWLGRYRRLSKDYEVLPATTEAWMYLAMSNLMTARLAI